jgi:hypothetical protein
MTYGKADELAINTIRLLAVSAPPKSCPAMAQQSLLPAVSCHAAAPKASIAQWLTVSVI